MNYLGHAFLSFGDSEIITGNLIGDHIKGKLALNNFPQRISKGILLHRKIDSFTDTHTATKEASKYFKKEYGLYSGSIMDVLFDHFLANDTHFFATESVLLEFSLQVFAKIDLHTAHLPETFTRYFPYMKSQNWLYNYRTSIGILQSLNGLSKRAKYIAPIGIAHQIFMENYDVLNKYYFDLIGDLIKFTKNELIV